MWLKIVPVSDSNAPGEWKEYPDEDIPKKCSWMEMEKHFAHLVTEGFVIVAFSSEPPKELQ